MEPGLKEKHDTWTIRGDRVQFIGTPLLCAGHVHLHNRSTDEVRIKRIPIAGSKLTGPTDVPVSDLRTSAKLLPGSSLQAPCTLRLPPQTPPGRYRAELVVGGERKLVLVDVLESWDLAIIPSALILKVHAGKPAVCTIQLTNLGNMSFTLPRGALVPLDESGGVNRSIVLSLKDAKAARYEDVLNELVKHLQETEVEPARVKIVSDRPVIAPGETQDLKLEISFPAKLKRNRRYRGDIAFENARLMLDIEVLDIASPAGKESAA